MSLRPVVIEQFPGLDLRQDPGDSAGAIDMANITLEPGRVRVRDGTSLLYTPATTPNNFYYLSQMFDDGVGRCIVGAVSNGAANLLAIRPGTGLVASIGATINQAGCSGTTFGTPSVTRFYLANPGQSHLFEWTGAAWSDVTGSSPAGAVDVVAVSPGDNRLVVIASPIHKVSFSNPGVALTFGANDFVQLTPGDGEFIQAAYVFNNQLFIFKQTKFFVFYGNSTDSTGNPIFNYRTVNTGIGISESYFVPRPQAACVGDDGIYFIGPGGIYRTSGGPAVRISQALQPWFDGTTGPYWAGPVRVSTNADMQRLAWLNGKLYYSTPDCIFVWDRALNAWSWWNFAVTAMGSSSTNNVASSPAYLALGALGAPSNIRLVRPTLTTDNGTAIVSRYRLPFETYGQPGQKRIREVIVEGSGAPTISVTADWSSAGITKALTLGTAPAISKDRMHNAWRGRAFSLQLSASSGAWAVNRVQANVADAVRPVSVTV